MEQFALCDVVYTEVKIKGGATYGFSTADEISCEPQIEEGEAVSLKLKSKLIAKKETPDTVTGHNIKLKDNVFTPEMLADIQGGRVEKESEKFKKYIAPSVGATPTLKAFDFTAYIEIVGEDGATGEYLKYTFGNCRGSFISPNFKDGEYYANEYTIKSRPSIGAELYTVELVDSLPVGAVRFMHPALQALELEKEIQEEI